MRVDLEPARLVSERPGGLGGRASLRGRAGPALAGGIERGWAGSTDIFEISKRLHVPVVCVPLCIRVSRVSRVSRLPPVSFHNSHGARRRPARLCGRRL